MSYCVGSGQWSPPVLRGFAVRTVRDHAPLPTVWDSVP